MSTAWIDEHVPQLPGEATSLRDLPMARFAAALASMEPSPGGGTAAALPAALAAGLVAMVARSTTACAPFSDLAFDMDALASEADELRAELFDLLDEDADAFEHVMAARRLPRETLEQRNLRSREIQRAYEQAVEPPCRVCQRSLRVLELAADVAERGHPHAAADADVAVLFAAASLDAAALTAEIYLNPVDSEAFRAARRNELQTVRSKAAPLRIPRAASAGTPLVADPPAVSVTTAGAGR
jgi:methenyltetrahydrofolate cyclohydrolase